MTLVECMEYTTNGTAQVPWYLFRSQFCEHIKTSRISELSILRCSLRTRPLVLNADSDATVCRCFTTDSLPQGYRGSIVRASAYAELDGKRKRQSIYPGSGPRS